MMFTAISMVVLWLVVDWMMMGSGWAHRLVFRHMSAALWKESSLPLLKQRAIMMRSAVTTGISAVSFTLLGEWFGFPTIRTVESLAITLVLYVGFVAPTILFDYFYFVVGRRFMLLQLWTWALKLCIGMVLFWAR